MSKSPKHTSDAAKHAKEGAVKHAKGGAVKQADGSLPEGALADEGALTADGLPDDGFAPVEGTLQRQNPLSARSFDATPNVYTFSQSVKQGPAAALTSAKAGVARAGSNFIEALSMFPFVTWLILAVLVVLVIAALVGIGSCVAAGHSANVAETSDVPVAAESTAAADKTVAASQELGTVEYRLTAADFSTLSSSSDSIENFSLSMLGPTPQISDDHANAILDVVAAFKAESAQVGFVLVDVDTGYGYSYNADGKVYGASSFKGPFASFVCENFVEGSDLSLESTIPSIGESAWGYYAAGEDSIGDLIQWSIIDSDNGAFGALREHFSGSTASGTTGANEEHASEMREAFRNWLSGLGANESIADDEEWFPFYTPRDAARFWTSVNNYLDTQTETAQFLAETLGETETSFMRDALKDTGATIIDKAGWYDDDPTEASEYNSICDNGVVMADEHKYLLCVMTSACYSESNVTLFENLVRAVFDARGDIEATR